MELFENYLPIILFLLFLPLSFFAKRFPLWIKFIILSGGAVFFIISAIFQPEEKYFDLFIALVAIVALYTTYSKHQQKQKSEV